MEKRHPPRVTPQMLLELKRLREEAAESQRIIEDLKKQLEQPEGHVVASAQPSAAQVASEAAVRDAARPSANDVYAEVLRQRGFHPMRVSREGVDDVLDALDIIKFHAQRTTPTERSDGETASGEKGADRG